MASIAPSVPILSGSMNWEPVRKRLLSSDLNDALKAARELRDNIEIVHTTEFPLMLSALLPAFSSVLAHRTRPSPDTSSVEHKLRHLILDIISTMPSNEVLRPHAPHLVALAVDILNRDYEENALVASRIIFDLYKVYRTLPQDYVQPYLDFVTGAYRSLPTAIQRNFSFLALSSASSVLKKDGSGEKTEQSASTDKESSPAEESKDGGDGSTKASPSDSQQSEKLSPSMIPGTSSPSSLALSMRSSLSFRVLTEAPLIVMLMLQLYPSFLKSNIPILISVMMEGLGLRAPPIQSIVPPGGTPGQAKLDGSMKRLYHARAR